MTEPLAKRSGSSRRARQSGPGARVVLKFPERAPLTDDLFAALAAENRDLRLERNAGGDLELMTPVGGDGSSRNFRLLARFGRWAEGEGHALGLGFDSSAGFTLPDGAIVSPDASWVSRARWEALPEASRRGFAPICPDFVVELRSASDRRIDLRRKLRHYLAQGARIGWLIDPLAGEVEIHRSGRPVEILARPARLSGEDVLPGFLLELDGILDLERPDTGQP